jgi:pyridoxine 4-dehydrogenase
MPVSPDSTGPRRAHPGGSAPLGAQTVARLGFGAMQLERLHDDRKAAVTLIRRAVELGVDHIDTAQFYDDGFVNDVLREALSLGDDVVIVSKVGADANPQGPVRLLPAQRPEELRASVENNLRSLGREQVSVVNLRRMDGGPGLRAEGDQVVDLDDQLAEMTALRDEGKIGAIGLSSITGEVLRRALPAGIACVQNSYSLVSRGAEDLLELCQAESIAWVPFFPLGSGFPGLPKVVDEPGVIDAAESLGCTPSQVGLAWLLQHAPHILLIPGTADVSHLEANLGVGDIVLTDWIVAALDGIPSRPADVRLA